MAAGTDHRHSVLVLEDVADSRDALRLLLESQGYEVTAAANGVEALQTMETFRPCVAIADLIMPTMDGLSFREEMLKRAEVAAIPVVALTGHEGLRRHALDMGFVAGLLKPCNFDELFGIIEGHCRRTAPGVRAKPA